MKISRPADWPHKALLNGGLILTGTLIAATFAAAATKGPTPDSPDWSATVVVAAPGAAEAPVAAIRFPQPVAAVLRLLDAKVDPEVIKAFIRNSNVMYQLSADQIIALKNRGVPSDILAMLVQRGVQMAPQAAPPGGPGYPGGPGGPSASPYGPGPNDQDVIPGYGYGYPYPEAFPYDNSYPYDDYGLYAGAGYPWGYGWGGWGWPYLGLAGYWPYYGYGFGHGFGFRNGFGRPGFGHHFGTWGNHGFAGRAPFAGSAGFAGRAPMARGFGGGVGRVSGGFGGGHAGGGFGGGHGGGGGGHR